MITMLTNYIHEYQIRLQQRAQRTSLTKAISHFTVDYRDHVRQIILHRSFVQNYRLPSSSSLAQHHLREARFNLLLAFEDVQILDYIARLHPRKQSYIEKEAALQFSRLGTLEEALMDISSHPPSFSPPPRSA